MSIARQHAEWLGLVETSGPFLSMPVLLRVFPQGLEAHDPDLFTELRQAQAEWDEDARGPNPDRAVQTAWIRWVLRDLLGWQDPDDEVLLEGPAIPAHLRAQLAGETELLAPDLVLIDPRGPGRRAGTPRVLLQTYPLTQNLDGPVPGRRYKASPATRMMELLHATGLALGLVTNGEHWLLVNARRGEATGFSSFYASVWLDEPVTLRAFRSLLGFARMFGVAEADTLEALLAESAQDQQEVTDQLGLQVRRAVEVLVQAIDRVDRDAGRGLLADFDERRLYEAAVTVMMRLVFLFAAEERRLLPLDVPIYSERYAASSLREQLREAADRHGEEILERRYDAWPRLLACFRAVHGGLEHDRLRLRPYGGSLFDPDRFPFLEGRPAGSAWRAEPARPLAIHNRTVLHLLEALQVLQVRVPGGGPPEARRLSFRALDIEQIGHVYV